ncbi:hypothetical protein [Scytonema sp. NUACC26]
MTKIITFIEENTRTSSTANAELKTELQESISHLVTVIGNFADEAYND